MLPWFLVNPARLAHERRAVDELVGADWIIGYEWQIETSTLILRTTLRVDHEDYRLRVVFPQMYPELPPAVFPEGEERRLSTHQYGGPDGPLCLEWGPDNWHSGVTAADVLKSAHRLLEIEKPKSSEEPHSRDIAPSRHSLHIGQELRGRYARWYASNNLSDFLRAQPPTSSGLIGYSVRPLGESAAVLVHYVEDSSATERRVDSDMPETVVGNESDVRVGMWLKTRVTAQELRRTTRISELEALDGRIRSVVPETPEGARARCVLIVDAEGVFHFFLVFPDGDVVLCAAVRSEETGGDARSPQRKLLQGKLIGIVGLGSIGSKVALSLARMGSDRFYLVDHDVLLPENVARHAATWEHVTQHKTHAVKRMLRNIRAGMQVDTAEIILTGQESNAVVNKVVARLAVCDVLIDATADPRTFSLLAAISKRAEVPLMWAQVYAGGLGGIVARSRPGQDADPHSVRAAYEAFCQLNPPPAWMMAARDYGIDNGGGEVVIAGDADVSVIADHLARYVWEACADERVFPYSLYLVGLREGWVFTAPFATIPIEVEQAEHARPESQVDRSEGVSFLIELLEKNDRSAASG